MSGKYWVYIEKPNTTQDVFVVRPLIYYWYVVWQFDEPTTRENGSALLDEDVWFDLEAGTIRVYKGGVWQKAGLIGNSEGGFAPGNVEFRIIDRNPNPATQTGLLSFYGGNTPDRIYVIQAQGGDLQIRKANDQIVTSFLANGDVKIWNNLEVVGDIILDDITTDVITLKDRIQHEGNTTNNIRFDVDKLTLDASGTSIVLDDTVMTNNVVITGSTQFVNNIDDVPDIYLRNHIHHVGDTNTRIGFPANDQIALRTGGVDRVLVTDASTTIGPQIRIADGAPKLLASMSGASESTRFTIQNSDVDGNSRFYVAPNGSGNVAAINFSNNSNLSAANQQRADIGLVGGECRFTATRTGTDPLVPFSWRTNAGEVMRQYTTGTGAYPADYDVLGIGVGVSLDGLAGIPQQGIMLKGRAQISWESAPGGVQTCIFRTTNSADLVCAYGWRNNNANAVDWESSHTGTMARSAVRCSSGLVSAFVNPSQVGTAGSATGVTPQQVWGVSQTNMQLAQNSATTTTYNQSISGLTPFFGYNIDIPTGRPNGCVYNVTVDASAYIGGVGYYNTTVGRGYIFSGALYGNSITNLSVFGIGVAVVYQSDTTLRISITDTSGVSSTKVGTVHIRLTTSN